MITKVLSIIVGVALVVLAYNFDNFFYVQEENLFIEEEDSSYSQAPRKVPTILARFSKQEVTISANGILDTRWINKVEAKVSGYINEVSEKLLIGSQVRQGELLLRFDDLDYQLQLSRAEAQLAESRLNLSTEQAEYQQANDVLRILDQGSEVALLAKRKYQLERAEKDYASKQIAIRVAKRNLAETRVTAEVEGLVLSSSVSKGEWVDIGEPMLELVDSSEIEVKVALMASELRLLADGNKILGLPVDITFDAHSDAVFAGSVDRLIPRLNEKTGSIVLIVDIEKPKSVLGAGVPLGAFASVRFSAKGINDAQWVPQSALLPTQTVWCVTSENRLVKLSVEVVQYKDNEVLIQLEPGNSKPPHIVIKPQADWLEGMEITPVIRNSSL